MSVRILPHYSHDGSGCKLEHCIAIVESSITKKQLESMPKNVVLVQVEDALESNEISDLANWMRRNTSVELRFFSGLSSASPYDDLTFCELLHGVERVRFDLHNAVSFDNIANIAGELKSLHIGRTRRKIRDFEFLDKAKMLCKLSLAGQENAIEFLPRMKNLVSLALINFGAAALKSLRLPARLNGLRMQSCRLEEPFNDYQSLEKLLAVQLVQCKFLGGYDWISKCRSLRSLHLDSCDIESLPSYPASESTKGIYLKNLPLVSDLNSLERFANLEEIAIYEMPQLSIPRLPDFFGSEKIRFLRYCLGKGMRSTKKDKAFQLRFPNGIPDSGMHLYTQDDTVLV